MFPANTNQAISFIRINNIYQKNIKLFLYFLQSEIIKEIIKLYAVQSAQPNLSMENLANIKMPFPDEAEQSQIAEYLDNKTKEIDNLISKKEMLINELLAYKKALIYECVTGKREVI